MKQVVYNEYGNSQVLKVEERKKPSLKKRNSLLIKVYYSSLNAIDWKNRVGDFKLVTGLFKPKTRQGFDVVGVVEGKSKDVIDFQIGDRVIALLGNLQGGALGDYILTDSRKVVHVPKGIELREVAGLPMAGTTAWLALVKNGKIKKGDKVLINGGSSGVGHFAIQIAKAYGAEVTSISSTKNLAFCKRLGADHVISYQTTNLLSLKEKYNILFDVVFNSSFQESKHLLEKEGAYIGTTPTGKMIKELLFYKQAKFVAVHPNKEALEELMNLIIQKKLSVNVDREYQISEVVKAHEYMEQSRTVGKVIIKI